MFAGFRVNGNNVGPHRNKPVDHGFGIVNHQMHVKRQIGIWADLPDNARPEGQIRHVMPVHHINMNHVGAGFVKRQNFAAEVAEIGSQNAGGNCDHVFSPYVGLIIITQAGLKIYKILFPGC